jgi:hypothetical protein
MEAIIAQYGIEILLAVITAGAIGLCKYFHSVAKKYKQRAEQDRYQEEQEHIEHALEPVVADIEELRAYMMTVDKEEKRKMDLIVSSYRFRLVQLCKLYLKQGYMTVEQFE